MLLLLASPTTGRRLVSALQPLVAAGLVAPTAVVAEAGGPPWTSTDGGGQAALVDVLAAAGLADLRVLSVVADDDITDLAAHQAVVDATVAALDRVVPSGEQPPLVAVLAPSAPDVRFPAEVLRGRLDHAVVLAAEDRRDPSSANVLPRGDAAHDRHLAAAVLTLGDAWTHTDGDTRALRLPPDAGWDTVRFVRTFGRIVDGGHLTDHLVTEALRPGASWPNPDPEQFEQVALGRQELDLLAGALVDAHAEVLRCAVVEPTLLPPHERPGLLEALQDVVQHVVRRIRRIPEQLVDRVVGTAYDALAAGLEKHDFGAGVEVRRWRQGTPTAQVLHEPRPPAEVLVIQDGAVGPAWDDYTRLALGLVDGSPLPVAEDRDWLRRGSRRVVDGRADAIAPHPRLLPPGVPDLTGTRACDPQAWDDAPWASPTAGGPAPETDPEFETPADAATQGAPDTTTSEEEDPWLAERSWSLAWLVGQRLAAEVRKAEHEAEEQPTQEDWSAFHEQAAELPARVHRRRRRWVVTLGLWSVLAIALGTAPWWLPQVAEVTVETWHRVLAPVVAVLFWVWRLAAGWRSCADDVATQERQVQAAGQQLADRDALARVRDGDAVRLARRYDEYLDWTEFVAHHLHEPVVAGSTQEDGDPVEPVPVQHLPAAVDAGFVLVSGLRRVSLVSRLRARALSPRWLTNYVDLVRQPFLDEWRLAAGLDEGARGTRGFDDTSQEAHCLRRSLVRRARAGEGRAADGNPLLEQAVEALAREDAATLLEGVRDASAASDWLGRVDLPAIGAEPDPGVAARVVRSTVLIRSTDGEQQAGASGFVVAPGVAATAAHAVPTGSTLEARVAGTWWPATLVADSVRDDVALVAVESTDAVAPLPLGDDRGLAIGSTLFAAGHTHLLEGDPTTSVGAVTALRRVQSDELGRPREVVQADYPGAGGLSGGPVTDHAGRVVGVHTSGAAPPEWARDAGPISFFSRAAALRTLLATVGRTDTQGGAGHDSGGEAVPLDDFLTIGPLAGGLDPSHALDQLRTPDLRVDGYATITGDPDRWWRLHAPLRIARHRVDWTAPVLVTEVLEMVDRPTRDNGRTTEANGF